MVMVTNPLPEIPVIFCRSNAGDEPVRDWLRTLPETDKGDGRMSDANKNWGSSVDEFLKEEGTFESAKAEAITRVVAWQIAEEMKKLGMTKSQMAESMHTSRAQIDRILKAKGNISVQTLQRAAHLVGRELRLELV